MRYEIKLYIPHLVTKTLTKPKACTDCAYFMRYKEHLGMGRRTHRAECTRKCGPRKTVTYDLVEGVATGCKSYESFLSCIRERGNIGKDFCGPEGKFWKSKTQRPGLHYYEGDNEWWDLDRLMEDEVMADFLEHNPNAEKDLKETIRTIVDGWPRIHNELHESRAALIKYAEDQDCNYKFVHEMAKQLSDQLGNWAPLDLEDAVMVCLHLQQGNKDTELEDFKAWFRYLYDGLNDGRNILSTLSLVCSVSSADVIAEEYECFMNLIVRYEEAVDNATKLMIDILNKMGIMEGG